MTVLILCRVDDARAPPGSRRPLVDRRCGMTTLARQSR